MLDLRWRCRGFNLRSGRYQVVSIWMHLWTGNLSQCITNTKVNSAYHPSAVSRVPACLTEVKSGRVHPCRVAGNTVISNVKIVK